LDLTVCPTPDVMVACWHWSTCFISTAMRVVDGRPTWAKSKSRSCVANLS
jgi:hypothetical protein